MTTSFIILYLYAGATVFAVDCSHDRSLDSAIALVITLIFWPLFILSYFKDL